ncbi:MAG: 4'-phosphopantetheinyl transferase superfamily protein [Acidobacteriota bacterium]
MMPLPICWLTQELSDVPENDEWLSDREREILAGLHVPKRRNDWRLGRWTAKRACRSFDPGLFTAMPQCEILAAADGGPDIYLAGGGPAPLSISISHSHARSFCTIAGDRRPVGCDLERIEMKSLDFFEDYFTPEEIDLCRLASPDAYPIACYLVWCAKESCLKILREGLRRDTRSIRIEAEFSSEKGSWNRWTGAEGLMG